MLIGGILLLIFCMIGTMIIHYFSIKKNKPKIFVKWYTFWFKNWKLFTIITIIIGLYEGLYGTLQQYGLSYSITVNLFELISIYTGLVIFEYLMKKNIIKPLKIVDGEYIWEKKINIREN